MHKAPKKRVRARGTRSIYLTHTQHIGRTTQVKVLANHRCVIIFCSRPSSCTLPTCKVARGSACSHFILLAGSGEICEESWKTDTTRGKQFCGADHATVQACFWTALSISKPLISRATSIVRHNIFAKHSKHYKPLAKHSKHYKPLAKQICAPNPRVLPFRRYHRTVVCCASPRLPRTGIYCVLLYGMVLLGLPVLPSCIRI